ncbi:MAG: hypothetical protein JSR46_05595 [Verrucomicrobia bacterium]|nr:hypothetical protein [Verrucomicrobiota bacterium]
MQTGIKKVVHDAAEYSKRAIFTKKYGTLASSEKMILIDTIIAKTLKIPEAVQRALNYNKYFSIELINDFRLVAIKSEPEQLDFWQEIEKKYRYYRGEYHEKAHQAIDEAYQNEASLIDDLSRLELSSENPKQDFKDRSRRIETLEQHRSKLQLAIRSIDQSYNDFLFTLSLSERLVFFIASTVQSVFKPAFHAGNESIVFTEFPNMPVTFRLSTNEVIGYGDSEEVMSIINGFNP